MARVRILVLSISIWTLMPNKHNLWIRREERQGYFHCESQCSWLLHPPGEMKTWQNRGQKGRGRGVRMREQRGESCQSVVGEGYIITHNSQPVGHAGLWESVSVSYLVLAVHEMKLPLTLLPVNSHIPWDGWGVMQRMLLSPCLLLLLLSHPPLLLQLINPQHFPLVSARNQIPPPTITDILNSWTLRKPCAVLFHCHVNYWSAHAQLLMPVRGSQNDSWSQELINYTIISSSSQLFLIMHGNC